MSVYDTSLYHTVLNNMIFFFSFKKKQKHFFILSGKYQTLLHCNPNPEITKIEKIG